MFFSVAFTTHLRSLCSCSCWSSPLHQPSLVLYLSLVSPVCLHVCRTLVAPEVFRVLCGSWPGHQCGSPDYQKQVSPLLAFQELCTERLADQKKLIPSLIISQKVTRLVLGVQVGLTNKKAGLKSKKADQYHTGLLINTSYVITIHCIFIIK